MPLPAPPLFRTTSSEKRGVIAIHFRGRWHTLLPREPRPSKSTRFEPKLRDGLLIHVI